MTTPTAIEQLTAQLAQVNHDIKKMYPVIDKAASNHASADELEKTAAADYNASTANRVDRIAAAGSNLAASIIEGNGVALAADFDDIDAPIRAADYRLAACTKAARSLREIHDEALEGLRKLKERKSDIVAALDKAKAEALAEKITQRAAELNTLIDELADQYPNDLDRPLNVPRRVPSPAIEAALAMRPGSDWINTPVGKLRARM